MVKGAHRNLMRKHVRGITPAEIEADFLRRMGPGLAHCQHVGNIMGATAMMSLASTIDNGEFEKPQRIGVFSYGSGCCSEFFSGVATQEGQRRIRALKIRDQLDRRYELTMAEYDNLLMDSNAHLRFGTRNLVLDRDVIPQARSAHGIPTLFLKEINEYHRLYEWVSR
jgi:polyketide biosynthesis 3-hydroxy-3-methylglutaryl-CoA synthase-like enzyme PksG